MLQQQILESVVTVRDHISIIEAICRLEERSVPNSVASVMLIYDDQYLEVLAAPSLGIEAIRQLNGLRPGPAAGSCGTAVFGQEPVFVGNTLTDERWECLRKFAFDFNVLACWSMPIRAAGGKVIGSFALSSFESRMPDAFHRMLLEIGAYIIGIVLDRHEAESKITYLGSHDGLTGLPNRMLARDRIEAAMAHAHRDYNRVAILFVDLDNFKMVNDSLGHEVGDHLLRLIAARLRECVRESDTIARHGGDEFLIVLPGIREIETITRVSDKILDRMAEPFHTDGFDLNSTISVGIAVYPDDGTSVDGLIRKADTAMYHAKEAGRNTYRYFIESMNADTTHHLQLRTDLHRALDKGEFILHYQPVFDVATGAIVGAEALLRWKRSQPGLLQPDQFIPLAESSGLIVPIGEWVLQTACRQAASWKREGLPAFSIAVNLSPVQFRRGTVEQTVLKALDISGLEPHVLELEITESVLLQDTEAVLRALAALKAHGVKIVIDDFGTGYSSFSYLRRLVADKLKIDRSFIQGMRDSAESASITRAMIQMAHGLNLRAVAEGVEHPEVMSMLRSYGCDEVQGFHLGIPVLPEAFSAHVTHCG